MYYIFPYARCVVVELARTIPRPSPCRAGAGATAIASGANGCAVALDRAAPERSLRAAADDLNFFFLRQGFVRIVRYDVTWPHAQHINYPRIPVRTNTSSACGPSRSGASSDPRGLLRFLRRLRKRTGYRCDLPTVGYSIVPTATRFLLIAGTAQRSPLTLPRPAARNWRTSCAPTTIFVARAAESRCSTRRRSSPTSRRRRPLATAKLFADYRRQAEPDNRLLDSYFSDLLSQGDGARCCPPYVYRTARRCGPVEAAGAR